MTDPDVEGTPAADADTVLPLDEFCRRHSLIERSVELLNAFYMLESHAGRTSATEADFVARLAAFAARPAV